MDEVQRQAVKGRGAISNESSRYERERRVLTDDSWGLHDLVDQPVRTTVQDDRARSIIARNQSPDVPFEQSVIPYRGCEHACIYCFARPSHAYLGLSPGLDFETRLFRKADAASLLDRALRAKSYRCSTLALGANTDPYQPIERTEKLTRAVLEVCWRFRQPVIVVTKSALVCRDIDILSDLAKAGLARVAMSVTTLDRDLARKMEPRASTPSRRLVSITALAQAQIPVSVLASPMIPGLNDHELERILEAASAAGATSASTILLRLPLEIKELFDEWLTEHYPDRADRVSSLIRQCRDGALYQNDFGTRMKGTGPVAELLHQRFRLACRRYGLNERRFELDTSQFRVPPLPTDQFSLF